jgi:hypothetical protein
MPIPIIMVLFINPVNFVHVKERFYKKITVKLIVTMHQPSYRGNEMV